MLRVVTYHRIADPHDTPDLDPAIVSATPEAFRKQMRHLARWYRPVSLCEVHAAFTSGEPLPSRAVHVTFDDAYRDFAESAWPVLRELGIPVTLFVPTAYPAKPEKSFWWDRLHRLSGLPEMDGWHEVVREAAVRHEAPALRLDPDLCDVRTLLREIPHDQAEELVDRAYRTAGLDPGSARGSAPVLSWDELRRLAGQGVRLGAHTREHVALSYVDSDRVRSEIRGSLADLRCALDVECTALAYPYGVCDDAVARVAREEGCELAFTCEDGLNRPGRTDPLRLCRTNITPRTTPAIFPIRMLPLFSAVDRWRHRRERRRLRT